MITFEEIEKLFAFDTEKQFCVEIRFSVSENEKYGDCWMGKLWSDEEHCDIFWFGLTPDGNNSPDYFTFEDMASAPVFDGLSLKEIWNHIAIEEIDGLDPEKRIHQYIDKSNNAEMEKIFETVKKCIDEWDPYDLLELHCPNDEFDLESKMISQKISPDSSKETIIKAVSEVFSSQFEADKFNFKNCEDVGTKIYNALSALK